MLKIAEVVHCNTGDIMYFLPDDNVPSAEESVDDERFTQALRKKRSKRLEIKVRSVLLYMGVCHNGFS